MELPLFSDCEVKIKNKVELNALEEFIYHNEPAGNDDTDLFRMQLASMIRFVEQPLRDKINEVREENNHLILNDK